MTTPPFALVLPTRCSRQDLADGKELCEVMQQDLALGIIDEPEQVPLPMGWSIERLYDDGVERFVTWLGYVVCLLAIFVVVAMVAGK